jgi:hypothetical protein
MTHINLSRPRIPAQSVLGQNLKAAAVNAKLAWSEAAAKNPQTGWAATGKNISFAARRFLTQNFFSSSPTTWTNRVYQTAISTSTLLFSNPAFAGKEAITSLSDETQALLFVGGIIASQIGLVYRGQLHMKTLDARRSQNRIEDPATKATEKKQKLSGDAYYESVARDLDRECLYIGGRAIRNFIEYGHFRAEVLSRFIFMTDNPYYLDLSFRALHKLAGAEAIPYVLQRALKAHNSAIARLCVDFLLEYPDQGGSEAAEKIALNATRLVARRQVLLMVQDSTSPETAIRILRSVIDRQGPNTRLALTLLSEIKHPEVIEALAHYADHLFVDTHRQHALSSILYADAYAAIDVLFKMARDSRRMHNRISAIHQLAFIRHPRARQKLLELSANPAKPYEQIFTDVALKLQDIHYQGEQSHLMVDAEPSSWAANASGSGPGNLIVLADRIRNSD